MRARGLPIEIPCSEPTMADLGPHLVPSVADLVGPRPVHARPCPSGREPRYASVNRARYQHGALRNQGLPLAGRRLGTGRPGGIHETRVGYTPREEQ